MNLFKEVTPFVVMEKELKRLFVENTLIVGDMRRSVGRPKASVLGSDRKQIDLDVGVAILTAILAEYESRNGTLDISIAHLRHRRPRRTWVSQKLSVMGSFNWAATGGNPIERFWNATRGGLLNIGISPKGLVRRITAAGAAPMDVHAFCEMVKRGELTSAHRASHALSLGKDTALAMGKRTLEEAYAEECERYRTDGDKFDGEDA
jgi:hypothetical protein